MFLVNPWSPQAHVTTVLFVKSCKVLFHEIELRKI